MSKRDPKASARERQGIEVERGVDGVAIGMPPAGNRWIIGLGLFGGIPWLLVFVMGAVVVAVAAPPELRRTAILGAIASNLLFFIVHILAFAGVWLALYNLSGRETLIVASDRITVARRAAGITVPMRLKRTGDARVALLDLSLAPGRGPHQRLEVRTAGSAMRFGAGLTAEEATTVAGLVEDVLREE